MLRFDGAPVQPTATALVDHWREGGALSAAEAIGMDLTRLLHGEAAWEYLVPVRVGDQLTTAAEVVELRKREGRRGGSMTFVTVLTTFTNQRGEVAVRRTDTLIERGNLS